MLILFSIFCGNSVHICIFYLQVDSGAEVVLIFWLYMKYMWMIVVELKLLRGIPFNPITFFICGKSLTKIMKKREQQRSKKFTLSSYGREFYQHSMPPTSKHRNIIPYRPSVRASYYEQATNCKINLNQPWLPLIITSSLCSE